MGISLGLDILPLDIDPRQWEQFYEEALDIVNRFPSPVLRLERKKVHDQERVFLSRHIEGRDNKGRFLGIAGDAQTGQWGGQFHVYRDLDVYRKKLKRSKSKTRSEKTEHGGEPVFLTRSIFLSTQEVVEVFSRKTQSRPYHDAVWCLITLAENRFPGRACGNGDLAAGDWERALTWLEGSTGASLRKPVLMDAGRLWDIFGNVYHGFELVQKVEEALAGPTAALYRLLQRRDPCLLGPLVKARLKEQVPKTVGASRGCLDVLDGTEDLYFLLETACLDPGGPQWKLAEVLHSVSLLGVFEPAGRPVDADRVPGFIPASLLPKYYRTDVYVEKEEACRKIGALFDLPPEKVKRILAGVEAKLKARQGEPVPAADVKPEISGPDGGRVSFPLPRQSVDMMREGITAMGREWDADTLHYLLEAAASQRKLVFRENLWDIIDREDEPDILCFLLLLFDPGGFLSTKAEDIEYLLLHLGEIRESWVSGQEEWVHSLH